MLLAIACATSALCFATACENPKNVNSRYEITAEYVPENATLAGATKLTFENTTDSELSTLKFQLYPNAYRKDAIYRPVSKT